MFSRKIAVAIVLVALFAFFSILLSVTTHRGPEGFSPQNPVITVTGPFQEAASRISGFAVQIWEGYFHLVNTAGKNRELAREVDRLSRFKNQCEEISQENQRLRGLLGYVEQFPFETRPARVVGADPTPWFSSMVINLGRKDGVKPGFAVVTAKGVAGRVVRTAYAHSLVQLLTDPAMAADARIQDSRARGICMGDPVAGCRMEYVLKKQGVKIGDLVVTSGLDQVFPPGLPLGKVTAVSADVEGMFSEVMVLPVVDFDKLEEVLVVFPGQGPVNWSEE